MIGGCCVDTLAYGGYSNDYPLLPSTAVLSYLSGWQSVTQLFYN